MAIHTSKHVFGSILFIGLMAHLDPAVGSRRMNLSSSHVGMDDQAGGPALGGTCELLVTVHGYPCKEYKVKTKDGYILSMQRIPNGRLQQTKGWMKKQPVLLQHGISADGMTWVMGPPDQALGFILADHGFDVWISNTRGTKWSRGHASLDPSRPEYWDWSWDELAEIELPSIVDFVYSQTGQKVDYVGHSMGTLIALAAFSQGKLMDQIKSAALLCPIAYLDHMTTLIGQLTARAFSADTVRWLGIAELNPHSKEVADLLKAICANPQVNCSDLLTAFTAVRNGIIMKFDYGSEEANMKHYGQSQPPVYNMSSISKNMPLFLSYGAKDELADVHDVVHLLNDLQSHGKEMLVVKYLKDYAHSDFVLGDNANKLVYDDLIAFFNHR